MIGSTGLLLCMFGALLLYFLISSINVPFDLFTFSFLLWNFTVGGLVCVFWHAPPIMNQGYLIVVSALLAIFFTRLPEWTTWAILVAIAIYGSFTRSLAHSLTNAVLTHPPPPPDLFAVLCPGGPLRVLVETAQARQEPIPALLYNGSVVFGMASETHSSSNDSSDEDDSTAAATAPSSLPPPAGASEPLVPADERSAAAGPDVEYGTAREPNNAAHTTPIDESDIISFEHRTDNRRAIKLGLGDFVFYSVLVGRAAMYDIITVFACFIAIITGLFLTLVLLSVFRKALPALPFSIALGTIFFLLSKQFLVPFVLELGTAGIIV